MFCKFCGKEVPDGSKFCRYCGKRLEQKQHIEVNSTAAAEAISNAEADVTPEAVQAPTSVDTENSAQAAAENGNKNKIALGVIIAVVVAIVVAIVVVFSQSNVPEDLVKDTVCESSTFSKGFVSNDYTNASQYTLTDFKITNTEKITDTLTLSWYGGSEGKKVSFEGKMKNDSFESEFTGDANFVKGNNDWKSAGNPSVTSKSTKPIKGVENFELSSSSSSSSSSDAKVTMENLKSTLDNSNGTYTSTATQDCKIEYWFGTDTATVTQKFEFDSKNGWKKSGNSEVANQKSTYSLNGKNFECTSSSTNSSSEILSLTFKESASAEAPEADYTIAYTPSASSGSDYKSVKLSGTTSGKITHTFGENKFKIELNDAGQQVSFSGSSSYPKEISGVGEMNTMSLSVKTNTNYYETKYYSTKYSTTGTFVEKKTTKS